MTLFELKSVSGNQENVDCAPCPAACSNSEYGIQMSYASIATASIDTVLKESKHQVIGDFNTAKDTQNRINENTMYSTLKNLKTVISDLEMLRNFLEINVLEESTSTFGRIEEGIQRIIDIAIEDINGTLYGHLPEWIDSYYTNLKPSRDAMYDIIKDSNKALTYLSQVLKWQSGTGDAMVDDRFKYGSLLSLFEEVSLNLKRVAMTLSDFMAYFHAISRVKPEQFEAVNDTLLPITLVYTKRDTTLCDGIQMSLLVAAGSIFGYMNTFAARLQKELDENDTFPHVSEIISPRETKDVQEHIYQFQNTSHSLEGCLSEYENYLDLINQRLTSVEFPPFKISDGLNTYGQMEDLNEHLRWLQTIYSNYQDGTFNKFDLVLESEKTVEVLTSIENLRTRIQQAVSIPLKTAIGDIERKLIGYYVIGMLDLLRVSGYFEEKRGEILSPVHELSIWRQPYASFDIPDILDFYLQEEEGKRSVPVYLISYIELDVLADVTLYLSNYFATLEEATHDIDASILLLTQHLQTSINTMDSSLADFHEETDVGKEFVR